MMNLDGCRRVIDTIDTEILGLLNRRASLSRHIGQIKTSAGLPVIDRGREETVMRRLVRENRGDIGDGALATIYREILNESRRIQEAEAAELVASGEQSR